MLKAIFTPRNRGFLFSAGTIALGLAVLSVFQLNRAGRRAYSPDEQSSSLGSRASVNLLAKNETTLFHKPNQFPFGIAKIAFNRDDAVYLYNAQTRESRRIGDGYDPEISPTGDVVVFTAERDDSLKNRTIKLFSLQTNSTSEFQSLAKLNVRQPRWSHDGTKLAFDVIVDRRTHVGILDVSTGEWYDVTKGLVFNDRSGIYLNSWSPDDRSIVCQDLFTIYEISLNGNVLNRTPVDNIVPAGEVASSIRLQFSRDKKFLLFDGARNPEYTAIYLFSFADQKLRQLTPKTMDGFGPVWLPSENEIMFSRGRDGPSGYVSDLCVLSLSSGKVTTIINDASSGSYSTR